MGMISICARSDVIITSEKQHKIHRKTLAMTNEKVKYVWLESTLCIHAENLTLCMLKIFGKS